MALAAGVCVGNVYAAQPLLDAMGASVHLAPARLGLIVSMTQIGYATGLVLLVPLGDRLDQRRLILGHMALSSLVLLALPSASSALWLLVAMALVGLLAVCVQAIVAHAAALAAPDQRGAVVGKVTGGVTLGILGARFVAGIVSDIAGWQSYYRLSAMVSAIITLWLVRHLPGDGTLRKRPADGSALRSMGAMLRHDPALRKSAFDAFIIFAAFSCLWTALVLPLSQAPWSLSHARIGLFGLVGMAGAAAARHAGRLVDHGHGGRVRRGAMAMLALSWLPIALLPFSLWWLVAGIVALDMAVQAVHVSNQTAMVARYPGAQSRVIAVYMVFYSLGSATGAILSSWCFALGGWSGVCALGLVISLLGVLPWRQNETGCPSGNAPPPDHGSYR